MKIQVDTNICVGHGRCYELAPEVFGENERGHCKIEREEVPPELEDKARAGVENCPEQALSLQEEG